MGFLQPSPKRQDLHRDGRCALHSFPPDTNEDAFYISGRAVLVDDHERRQAATAQFLAERKLPAAPEDFDTQDLFEFYLERCLWTATSGHGDWNPRHTIWRSSYGVSRLPSQPATTRRTSDRHPSPVNLTFSRR